MKAEMPSSVDDITHNSPPTAQPTAPVSQGPSPYLIVIAGPSFGEMYKLKGDRSVLGRGDRADIRVVDDGVSREHAAIERQEGKTVLVDLNSTNGTFWNGKRVPRQDLSDGDKIAIGANTILKFTYQDRADEHYQKRLFESALRDGLTSTFNRRYFMDRLHAELRFANRHGKSVGLLFVDIDHFKKINDAHGHLVGDKVLSGVAHALTATIRAEDVLARYGGEEFAIICREIEEEGAQALGERLRTAIEGKQFDPAGTQVPVTISIGAAICRGTTEAQALIAAADAAMYEAKRTGRNRVCLAGKM
jgi:two-component system cell cycle response regulator